ncbi:MAG TPA: DUF58 domain-containing protein [Gemmatimonadaceae bacterium]|nr:DUF58 domain-containing protein [Gemmatimonadaceae bacterium]
MDNARGQRADLLDPATIAALGRIEIIARWIVDGFLTGLHRSPRKGFSVEFAEHRPYQPGDELRYVDWKIAARADRWVVKQYEEETNLRATIVLDVSRSMAWTGDAARLTKLAYAERLTAALSLLFLRQHDAVGLVRFDEAIRTSVPPRARSGHWRRIVASLDDPGSGHASRAPDALEKAGRLIVRRGMVVLISDLLMEPDDVLPHVRSLRLQGHHVAVLHLLDPSERELPLTTDAVFVDPESSTEVTATVADVRAAYRATVEAALQEWRSSLTALGASYETITTDAPFGVPLRRAFAVRQRLP